MALILAPIKNKPIITIENVVEACVKIMRENHFASRDLSSTEVLSRLFSIIPVDLGLTADSSQKNARRRISRYWKTNETKLLPLIIKRIEDEPTNYHDDQDSPNNGLSDKVTELCQKVSELAERSIESEKEIKKTQTNLEIQLSEIQKTTEEFQVWTNKEINSLNERLLNISDIPPESSQKESDSDYELAPEPARAGKSHTIKRPKVWGTLDPELAKLLKEEAKKKGVTWSRILDTAVWHFLAKPALSFQKVQSHDDYQ